MTTQQHRPAHLPPAPRNHAPIIERTMYLPQEGIAMKTLRGITYVLCSLASIVFLLVVLYVNNKITEFQSAMETLFGGPSATSSPFGNPPGKLFGN